MAATTEDSAIKVAWMIHAYRNPEAVIDLVKTIYAPGDSVWIHYDRKSPVSEFEQLRLAFGDMPDVHAFHAILTYWGGFEITAIDIMLSDKLLESGTAFDFVIHLTGTTFPIKPVAHLRRFLAAHSGKSFLRTTPRGALLANPPEVRGVQSAASGDPEHSDQRRHFMATQHFGVWRNQPYMSSRNPRSVGQMLRQARFATHMLKVRAFRQWRRMLGGEPVLAVLPRTFPRIYRGFVHDMIWREHFKVVHQFRDRDRWLSELRVAAVSDELYYHTTLRNLVAEDEIVNDHYLFTLWGNGSASPETLNLSHLPALRSTNAFFARKFEDRDVIDQILTDMVEDPRGSKRACPGVPK